MYINNVMSVELLVKNKLWTRGWEIITTTNLTYTKQPPVGSVIDQRINIISCQRLTIVQVHGVYTSHYRDARNNTLTQ